MKISISASQSSHVYAALNAFWHYYFNTDCPVDDGKLQKALSGLYQSMPETVVIICNGEAEIDSTAFLASYILSGNLDWLRTSGLATEFLRRKGVVLR